MTPQQVLSLVVFTSVTRMIVTLGLAAYALWNRTYPGFLFWVAGSAVGSLGVLAVGLRAVALGPSALLANTLVPLSLLLLLDGTCRFVRGRPMDRRWYALTLVSPVLIAVFLYGVDLFLVRIWVGVLYISGLSLALALVWREPSRPVHRTASLLYGAYAATMLARGLAWSFGPPAEGLLAGGPREGLLYLVVGVLDLGTQVVFIVANNQRLAADLEASNRELEQALEELQESTARDALLSGILPLCPGCRRIRGEGDEWMKLETYVSRRTEARFSHGLCDDCIRRLYPEMADQFLDGPHP